jgi:hypothetical protein
VRTPSASWSRCSREAPGAVKEGMALDDASVRQAMMAVIEQQAAARKIHLTPEERRQTEAEVRAVVAMTAILWAYAGAEPTDGWREGQA